MKTPNPLNPVALAVATAVCAPAPLPAQETRLATVSVVEDDASEASRISSPRYTAPLLDTPQSITVISQDTIASQNLLSLRDILATVPGITFGAGEGGGGYGDSINLRGFAGSSDVTIDGFRDSAQYTRSDPFNLEQVEVVNGANSVFSGAGAVGGTINLVSKSAHLGDASRIAAGLGTDQYGRVTGDFNQQLGDTTALRWNVMGHRNDVPDRQIERNRRWGIATSLAHGLGTRTALSLALLHQHDNNTPQYGVPTWEGRILPGADRQTYFGYGNVDRQVSDTDSATLIMDHAFSEALSLRSQSRWQQTDQFSRVDPPQGTFCLANGTSPSNAGVAACPAGYAPGQYQPSGPRGTTRDTRNRLLAMQSDLTTTFGTGPVKHTLVAGFSVSRESYALATGNSLRNADGSAVALPRTTISRPDTHYTGPLNFIISGTTQGELDNHALYAFDNVQLSARWSLNAGARIERNEDDFTVIAFANPGASGGGVASPAAPGRVHDTLFSYRAGLVFKPRASGSLYLAYGNSATPSVSSVNGTCTSTGLNNNCNLDPEQAANLELGAKWEALAGRLSVSAALSRNERTNYRVNEGITPDNPTGQQVLDGRARVDALLLGVAGRIRDNWNVIANYTFLDSKVLQGAADSAAASGQDYTRADPLPNTPRNAASLWTTWDAHRGLQLGYGLTWQGQVFTAQHTAPTGAFPVGSALPITGGYVVHRAMASYSVNRGIQLQLNVNNIFDRQYLTRVRTQRLAWSTPGEARSIVLSANFSL